MLPLLPIIATIGIELIKASPDLHRTFANKEPDSPERAAMVERAVVLAVNVTGAVNAQDALVRINSNPDTAAKFQAAVKEQWFELTEAGGGIKEARDAAIKAAAMPFLRNPAALMTLALLPLVYTTVGAVLFMDQFNAEMKALVVGAIVSGVLGAISGYWLGTSFGSAQKTDLMARRK